MDASTGGAYRSRRVDRSSPPWMMTYGDMATLLLVFFVFLFSVSDVRKDKFKAATGALRAQIGLRPRRGSVVEARKPISPGVRRRERREKARWGLPGKVEEVRAAAWGPRVVVGGNLMFDRGSADISDEARQTLRELADELRGLPNIVEVRGHAEPGEAERRAMLLDKVTEGIPREGVGKPGRLCDLCGKGDDLALSLARAAAVLRFLVKDAGLRLSRLRAVGAGAEEPAFHGEEPHRNRRVEIVVLRRLAREARPAVEAPRDAPSVRRRAEPDVPAVPVRDGVPPPGARRAAPLEDEPEAKETLPPVMGPLDVE